MKTINIIRYLQRPEVWADNWICYIAGLSFLITAAFGVSFMMIEEHFRHEEHIEVNYTRSKQQQKEEEDEKEQLRRERSIGNLYKKGVIKRKLETVNN